MATFEQRRDAAGRTTAIRVKVRRAGQPHLSRTFRVEGTSADAVDAARAQAQAWADTLGRSPQQPARAALTQAWQSAASPEARADTWPDVVASNPWPEDAVHAALAAAPDTAWAALLRFVLATGLQPEALAAMRWQHLDLAAHTMQVHAATGVPLRRVQLLPEALDALLSLAGRKHGLVFKQDAAVLAGRLAQLARAGDADPLTVYRAAAWRLRQAGLSPSAVARQMGWSDLSALGSRPPGPDQPTDAARKLP